jgi:hypothetical protein
MIFVRYATVVFKCRRNLHVHIIVYFVVPREGRAKAGRKELRFGGELGHVRTAEFYLLRLVADGHVPYASAVSPSVVAFQTTFLNV